jgi:hypothetical protein
MNNSKQTVMEMPKDLGHLPSTVAELVPLYRDCIIRFDAAVRARDFETAGSVYGEAQDIIERAESFERFTSRGFRYCFHDVAQIFDWLTRARPGSVPLFGQKGNFETFVSITKVNFQTEGLGGSLGMSAYNARVWGFEIGAVEWDRGFYSATGYRSFLCSSLEVGERSDDVRQWCIGHLRHWWNGSGGKPTKFALHRIQKHDFRPSNPLPVPVDDDTMECSACDADLSQMDEYGECSETGAVFCTSCSAKHGESCAECLPPAEPFEDEGRTDAGNGYPAAPASKQLSLF